MCCALHTATEAFLLQRVASRTNDTDDVLCIIQCNTLQHTATHCNTLQHNAVHRWCVVHYTLQQKSFCRRREGLTGIPLAERSFCCKHGWSCVVHYTIQHTSFNEKIRGFSIHKRKNIVHKNRHSQLKIFLKNLKAFLQKKWKAFLLQTAFSVAHLLHGWSFVVHLHSCCEVDLGPDTKE